MPSLIETDISECYSSSAFETDRATLVFDITLTEHSLFSEQLSQRSLKRCRHHVRQHRAAVDI